jgi:hypothetical protein
MEAYTRERADKFFKTTSIPNTVRPSAFCARKGKFLGCQVTQGRERPLGVVVDLQVSIRSRASARQMNQPASRCVITDPLRSAGVLGGCRLRAKAPGPTHFSRQPSMRERPTRVTLQPFKLLTKEALEPSRVSTGGRSEVRRTILPAGPKRTTTPNGHG